MPSVCHSFPQSGSSSSQELRGFGGGSAPRILLPLSARRAPLGSVLQLGQPARQPLTSLMRSVVSDGVSSWRLPLGFEQRPLPAVSQAIGPSVSANVPAPTTPTLVLGPLAGPTIVKSALVAASVTGAFAASSCTFRVWLSQTSVADTAPQPGDVELTSGAVLVQLGTAPSTFPVAYFHWWMLPTLFGKLRVVGDAVKDTRWMLTLLIGGQVVDAAPVGIDPVLSAGSGFGVDTPTSP